MKFVPLNVFLLLFCLLSFWHSHYVYGRTFNYVPHFSEALLIFIHSFFSLYFMLHNYGPVFTVTDSFFCQLISTAESLCSIYCTFQLQNLVIFYNFYLLLLIFSMWWDIVIMPFFNSLNMIFFNSLNIFTIAALNLWMLSSTWGPFQRQFLLPALFTIYRLFFPVPLRRLSYFSGNWMF